MPFGAGRLLAGSSVGKFTHIRSGSVAVPSVCLHRIRHHKCRVNRITSPTGVLRRHIVIGSCKGIRQMRSPHVETNAASAWDPSGQKAGFVEGNPSTAGKGSGPLAWRLRSLGGESSESNMQAKDIFLVAFGFSNRKHVKVTVSAESI